MGTCQRFPLYALSFVRITGYGCPHQAHECRTLCAQMPCLLERLCEAKYSELYPPEGALIKDGLRPSVSAPFLRQRIYTLIRERYDGAFLGALRPCSLASSIEDSTSRPSELRKRTLVLVLGQVVLTEPLRFRLGHPMDHSNAAGFSSSLRFLRCEPLTLACPLMGYVCRFVAMCS